MMFEGFCRQTNKRTIVIVKLLSQLKTFVDSYLKLTELLDP